MNLEIANSTSTSRPHKAPAGLRWVAIYEILKGLLFLAIALGALSLVHKDVGDKAQEILKFFHLDPAWHYSKLFIEESNKVTDARLRYVALTATLFAIIRLVAGFGLWHEKHWAEWFAVICAGLYLPIEIHHFWVRPNWKIAGVIIVNLAIIVYLTRIIIVNHKRRKAAASVHSQ